MTPKMECNCRVSFWKTIGPKENPPPLGPSTILSTECSGNTWVLTQTSFLQVRFKQWFRIWKLIDGWDRHFKWDLGNCSRCAYQTPFTYITRCEQTLRKQLSVWNNSRLGPTAARHGDMVAMTKRRLALMSTALLIDWNLASSDPTTWLEQKHFFQKHVYFFFGLLQRKHIRICAVH